MHYGIITCFASVIREKLVIYVIDDLRLDI